MRIVDFRRKHLKSMKVKSLRGQLSRTIRQTFPRFGGARITDLLADIILEVVESHVRPRDSLHHGQLLWLGPWAKRTPAGSRLA